MGLFTWSMQQARKLEYTDWVLLKLNLLILGAIIGSFVATFVQTYLWYFVVLFVVLEAVLIYRFAKRK